MRKYTINYNRIYSDIIDKKFPEKKDEYSSILSKKNISAIEILKMNKELFGTNEEDEAENRKHHSYSRSDILRILDYQKKHQLNNIQLANHFKVSRNTITKWKGLFVI